MHYIFAIRIAIAFLIANFTFKINALELLPGAILPPPATGPMQSRRPLEFLTTATTQTPQGDGLPTRIRRGPRVHQQPYIVRELFKGTRQPLHSQKSRVKLGTGRFEQAKIFVEINQEPESPFRETPGPGDDYSDDEFLEYKDTSRPPTPTPRPQSPAPRPASPEKARSKSRANKLRDVVKAAQASSSPRPQPTPETRRSPVQLAKNANRSSRRPPRIQPVQPPEPAPAISEVVTAPTAEQIAAINTKFTMPIEKAQNLSALDGCKLKPNNYARPENWFAVTIEKMSEQNKNALENLCGIVLTEDPKKLRLVTVIHTADGGFSSKPTQGFCFSYMISPNATHTFSEKYYKFCPICSKRNFGFATNKVIWFQTYCGSFYDKPYLKAWLDAQSKGMPSSVCIGALLK